MACPENQEVGEGCSASVSCGDRPFSASDEYITCNGSRVYVNSFYQLLGFSVEVGLIFNRATARYEESAGYWRKPVRVELFTLHPGLGEAVLLNQDAPYNHVIRAMLHDVDQIMRTIYDILVLSTYE